MQESENEIDGLGHDPLLVRMQIKRQFSCLRFPRFPRPGFATRCDVYVSHRSRTFARDAMLQPSLCLFLSNGSDAGDLSYVFTCVRRQRVRTGVFLATFQPHVRGWIRWGVGRNTQTLLVRRVTTPRGMKRPVGTVLKKESQAMLKWDKEMWMGGLEVVAMSMQRVENGGG